MFVQKDPGDQPVIETTNDEFIEYPSVVGLELDPMQALLDQLEAQVEAITEPGAPTTMKLEDPLDQLEFIHQPFPFETIISPEQTSPSDLSEKIPVNPPPLDPWGWEDPLANSQEFDGPPDNLYGPLRDDWNPWDERPPRDNLLRSDEPYPADPWADW